MAGRIYDREPWRLETDVSYLNHGAFGACPEPVLEAQRAWRDRMERQPARFLGRELEALLDEARSEVAVFLNADPEGLAFVHNATAGVSTVLNSLRFQPGDELLACDHEYNATLNALRAAAERDGAKVVLAHVPFPVADAGQVVQAYLDAASPRTRLALVSQVTSPTALVMPVVAIVRELERRGIDTLVDGAHAPGMIPCDVRALNAAYWTANGHKWLCAPKGAGLLHVRADLRERIRPLATSHGANSDRSDRSRFRLAFDWTGTGDPSPWLTLPAAIRFVGGLHEDGWAGLMAANRTMARDARDRLCNTLGIPAPAPDAMVGAMASVPLAGIATSDEATQRLQAELLEEDGIEVPIIPFPVRAARGPDAQADQVLLRLSAQRYVRPDEFTWLADRVGARVKAARSPRSLLGRLRRG